MGLTERLKHLSKTKKRQTALRKKQQKCQNAPKEKNKLLSSIEDHAVGILLVISIVMSCVRSHFKLDWFQYNIVYYLTVAGWTLLLSKHILSVLKKDFVIKGFNSLSISVISVCVLIALVQLAFSGDISITVFQYTGISIVGMLTIITTVEAIRITLYVKKYDKEKDL